MKVLLACSGGGHLKELYALVPRLGIEDRNQVWLTVDTGLSRSLLHERDVVYLPHVQPRDAVGTARVARIATSVIKRRRITSAVSTGALPGLGTLPVAAARGLPAYFIESAARSNGPSLTGRILSHLPGIATYSQYPSWAGSRWAYAGSVYDEYAATTVPQGPRRIRKAVVTLGTTEGFPFPRLVDHVARLLRHCDEVLWQTGDTPTPNHTFVTKPTVSHEVLKTAIAEADVVISHCGTGSALTALEMGKLPVLIPRWAAFGEHIDDHQIEIGQELARRKLAILREAAALTYDDLLSAASHRVARVEPPPFLIDGRL